MNQSETGKASVPANPSYSGILKTPVYAGTFTPRELSRQYDQERGPSR